MAASRFIGIIDDDRGLCCSLVNLMHSYGYRAESFATAESFIDSSDQPLFDCVIIDVHLPGMSGVDLAKWLRSCGSSTAVILISALQDDHLDEQATSAGALCLLRKPFDATRLIGYIEMKGRR
jgi:FixJ family two-component response regulator